MRQYHAISKIYLISIDHETIPNTLSIQCGVQERCVCELRDIFITAVDVLLLMARRQLFSGSHVERIVGQYRCSMR